MYNNVRVCAHRHVCIKYVYLHSGLCVYSKCVCVCACVRARSCVCVVAQACMCDVIYKQSDSLH